MVFRSEWFIKNFVSLKEPIVNNYFMKKLLILSLCSIFFMSFAFYNSSEFQYLVVNKLKEYTSQSYPEKIYVQTDKPYYIVGEDLWFNTYLVNGITHQKSNKSKVIYVELIDTKDSVIAQRKLFTENLSAHGDFKIPIGVSQGKYLLRAYTKYMQNQDDAYFFKKEIPIFSFGDAESIDVNKLDVNSLESPTATQKNIQPNIGFYPEGGYLVEGILNKVAVKVKNQELLETNTIGFIEDNNGNRVTDFKTFEFGLGAFFLNPQPNKTYKAVVVTNETDEVEYELPKPLQRGYVMATSVSDDALLIELTTNMEKGLKNTFILGHQRGQAVFDRFQRKDTKNVLFKIPKDNFTKGVLNITLFNEEEKPIAERLIYINNENENVAVSVKNNASVIGVREKVNLDIAVRNTGDAIVPSTLSVSVRDAETTPQKENSETIETWFLLNSDLRGKIESPGYFFKKENKIKREYLLDLTMLTHGWRRFTWQELLQENTVPDYKAEKGLYINGITVNATPPYRQRPAETRLTFKREGLYQEVKETNTNGSFSYGPFVYHDSINILIEASIEPFKPNVVVDHKTVGINLNKSIKRPKVERDNSIKVPVIQNIKFKENLKEQAQVVAESYYQFNKEREQLEEVFLKAKVETEREKEEAERNKRTQYFAPSHRVIVEDLGVTGALNFLQLLLNIPGVIVLDVNAMFYNESAPSTTPITVRGGAPSYYLNGRKSSFNIVSSIAPGDIEFIDVLKPPNTLAFALEANGVIVVWTKEGASLGTYKQEKKPGSISFNSPGFYTAREFFAPDYAQGFVNSNREDNRSTIHWEPKIETSENSDGVVSFYTSDQKGTYIIEIEGMTHSGVPVHSVTTFEVN